MNRFLPAAVVLSLALTGCVALNHRDRAFLESHGVSSGPVYDRMMHHEPLTLDEIIELSRKGIPGPFIVHYLRPTYSTYKLSPGDAIRLRQAGVSEGVIRYLSDTQALYGPTWYDDDPHFYDPYWDYRRY